MGLNCVVKQYIVKCKHLSALFFEGEANPCVFVPILHREGGDTLAQVAQRNCGCPLPGSVQGQVGWSSEQPGLVEGVPAHGRGVGTR